MKAKLLFVLLFIAQAISAADLPLYARWQSRHFVYYDTLQSGKELSWDELYRAELGMQGLEWKALQLAFALDTEEFFNEALIKLKSLELKYQVPDSAWYLAAGTELKGYGHSEVLDNMPVMAHGYQPYRFQPMRLNALSVGSTSAKGSNWELHLGGNKHNQASLLLSHSQALSSSENAHYGFCLDARAMDNHWRTPVCIPALEYSAGYRGFNWNVEAAAALLPEWEATKKQVEYFAVGQLSYALTSSAAMATAAYYKEQGYAPHKDAEYRFYLNKDMGNLSLSPILSRQEVDSVGLWKYSLITKYKVLQDSHIGAYYEYSRFRENKPRHSMGLAVDLEFNPAR